MNDYKTLIVDFGVGCFARGLNAAFWGLWMFAGCGHRPEAANVSRFEVASKSSMSVESSAEPLDPKFDIKLSGETIKPEPVKPRSEEDPVRACLSVSPEKFIVGETFELTVVLSVNSGYEIHNLSASPPKTPTILELQLPPGFTALDEWRSPEPVHSFNPGSDLVYLGETNFIRRIHAATDIMPGDYLLACSVSYQACNSRQCLRPIKTILSVKVSLSR